ncbi:MAG: hypothetical protein Q7U68_05415 [Candidatus Roizmanbacteria bacterium]|nr:hypothetical protein [Candidatus Roizmanbacteria bacterium]
MDTTQLLLSTAVTITTILLIIVSIQLISLLKQFKKPESPLRQSADGGKKDKVIKKKINLTSLLDRIKILTPHDHSPKKKFFKSV